VRIRNALRGTRYARVSCLGTAGLGERRLTVSITVACPTRPGIPELFRVGSIWTTNRLLRWCSRGRSLPWMEAEPVPQRVGSPPFENQGGLQAAVVVRSTFSDWSRVAWLFGGALSCVTSGLSSSRRTAFRTVPVSRPEPTGLACRVELSLPK
jgi:hypothetical protein